MVTTKFDLLLGQQKWYLDLGSAVTVQNGEFKGSFHSSHSRLLSVET